MADIGAQLVAWYRQILTAPDPAENTPGTRAGTGTGEVAVPGLPLLDQVEDVHVAGEQIHDLLARLGTAPRP